MDGNTLKQVGEAFGVTTQRARQMCNDILGTLQEGSIKLHALEKVLAAAEQIAPFSMEEANAQLAHLLGDGCGLSAALDFATVVGMPTAVQAVQSKVRTLHGYKSICMVDADPQVSRWFNVALAYARQECMFVGCTNFLRIAGHLALQKGIAVDLPTLQSIFSNAPGFRMLDEASGWFTPSHYTQVPGL